MKEIQQPISMWQEGKLLKKHTRSCIKCPNCGDDTSYNGNYLNARFWKCDTCGKITMVDKRTGEIIRKGEWIYH